MLSPDEGLRIRIPRSSPHPEPINPSPSFHSLLQHCSHSKRHRDMEIALRTDAGSVGLPGRNACLSQVRTCYFGRRGSGIWGRKSTAAAGSRGREWRSMVAKNEKRPPLPAGESTESVATSAVSMPVNGKAVVIEDPSECGQVDRDNVASIILGGASGDHLFPLTRTRAPPAVPVGGSHRLIDIPMSNCVNSGIQKIFVMTQFNSTSLNRHISKTYSFINENKVGNTFLEVLAATQSSQDQMTWFRGTADAVRQFAWLLEGHKSMDIEYIIILSGDQLYRMDFMDLVQKHVDTGAQITISCVPVDDSRASNYGLLRVDMNGRVIQFEEKPEGIDFEAMKYDNSSFLGLHRQGYDKYSCIASMGVYVFNKSTLLEILRKTYPTANDFGSHILPHAVKEYEVQAYIFDGYWEDIGTIKSFFDANLALTDQSPKFQFYDQRKSIITKSRFLPPIKIEKCRVMDSIISHGCFLEECSIEHSIIGVRSCIGYGAHLKDTLMLGSDKYETGEEIASLNGESKVPIGVGRNAQIRNCIIDRNARIGRNVVITNKDGVQEADRPNEGFYIRSGITIIAKNATIKDETAI